MKILAVVLVLLAVAGAASANISPDDDVMGIYFDTDANVYCINGISPYTPIIAYLIYTNPTPETILAMRAGIQIEGELLVLSATSSCNPFIVDDGVNFDCGWGSPQPTTPTMILASFEVLYMSNGDTPMSYYLGSLDDPWNGLPSVMLPDGSWLETELPFGTGYPVASVNTECVLGSGESTFGHLKSLYR